MLRISFSLMLALALAAVAEQEVRESGLKIDSVEKPDPCEKVAENGQVRIKRDFGVGKVPLMIRFIF